MSTKLCTLEAIHGCLVRLGYDAKLSESGIMVAVGNHWAPFPLVITQEKDEAIFSCQIAQLSDIPENSLAQFAMATLDANLRIRPFAFAMLADDNIEMADQTPIVLIDAIPCKDLDESEVARIMDCLLVALTSSRSVFETIAEPVSV